MKLTNLLQKPQASRGTQRLEQGRRMAKSIRRPVSNADFTAGKVFTADAYFLALLA